MKTAVEQLIEEMQSYSYKVSKEDNLDMVAAFDYAIGIAKKYKEKGVTEEQKNCMLRQINLILMVKLF